MRLLIVVFSIILRKSASNSAIHLNTYTQSQLLSAVNRNGVEMHKTFTSTWAVGGTRRNLHRKHIRVGDANRCRTKYEAIHFLTHHKIGHKGNDAHQVVFLKHFFPFIFSSCMDDNVQQLSSRTRHECVCLGIK